MKTESMKLYQSSASPNSRRVRIYLAERGICVTQVPVDLGAKEQFSSAFAAINPRQVVPVLVLGDGSTIGEVPAIWRYFEEAYPERPLMGTTPREKALAVMWERRMELEGFAAVMETVRNKAPGLKGRAISGPHDYEQIPAIVERGLKRVQDFYEDLEKRLVESPFIAGDQYTVADITGLATIDFASKALNQAQPTGPATSRWYKALSERASSGA
jgi:glutathione S-transferase